jgi:SHS2 domain-containing protein
MAKSRGRQRIRASHDAAHADLRIEAWAPTRDGCIREAVLCMVETFLDTPLAYPKGTRRCRLTQQRDDDLLVAVLDEVIYLLDTEGEAPVDLDLHDLDGAVDVNFAIADATTLPQLGAVPKAVSLNEIRPSQGRAGWRCLVTLDV